MDKRVRHYLLREIPRHPHDIVTYVAGRLGLSRQAVHHHLTGLIARGEVTKTGEKKGTRYGLAGELRAHFGCKLDSNLREDEVWTRHLEGKCAGFRENVRRILYYGFTEMLNNAIDHSEGGRVVIDFEVKGGSASISIRDDGIGIFRKIQKALNLTDPREALLQLTKGKFTTDPSRHSGEGIFFTSRAVNTFYLDANGMTFVHTSEDWYFESKPGGRGTDVYLEVKLNSEQTLEALFREYTDAETHQFNVTQIMVELAKNQGEVFVSRSQAKRVVQGLEKFKHIILDFKGVQTVGQGFVDEVFRVFKNRNPGIQITTVNANPDVEFMIKRSLP